VSAADDVPPCPTTPIPLAAGTTRPARIRSSRSPPSATTWRGRDLPGGGEALAERQDHAPEPGAGDRAELAWSSRSRSRVGATFRARTQLTCVYPLPDHPALWWRQEILLDSRQSPRSIFNACAALGNPGALLCIPLGAPAGFGLIGRPLGRTPGSAASKSGGSRTTVVREFRPR
jgi:hypothetical protein